jgi:hypothetical protein
MVKRFQPVFSAEDLMKLPNYESVTSVLINGVPSSPFSMQWIPPMGHPNQQLADALRRLSAAKYGRDRSEVEQEIFKRLNAAKEAKEAEKQSRLDAMRNSGIGSGAQPTVGPGAPPARPAGPPPMMAPSPAPPPSPKPSGGSFLDDWLAKRQQIAAQPPRAPLDQPAVKSPTETGPRPVAPPPPKPTAPPPPALKPFPQPGLTKTESAPSADKAKANNEMEISRDLAAAKSQAESSEEEQAEVQKIEELSMSDDGIDEVSIDLRGNMNYKNSDE